MAIHNVQRVAFRNVKASFVNDPNKVVIVKVIHPVGTIIDETLFRGEVIADDDILQLVHLNPNI